MLAKDNFLWKSILMLNIVTHIKSWVRKMIYLKIPKSLKKFSPQPTVKINLFKYDYHTIEPTYIDFNVTELKSGGHIMYFNIRKDNLMLWSNTAIHFENKENEYTTEFMNKTINICKMLNNRRHEPFINALYQAVYEKMPTLPKRCPIKKVSLFYSNFTLIS